jgi:hypothetical protein
MGVAGIGGALDPGNLPPYVSGGLTDVGYDGGLSDSAYDYTGSTTLQDVVAGSDTLSLSSEYGLNPDGSVYDFINGEDPVLALQLSGAADYPFLSSVQSSPTPNAAPMSTPTAFGVAALQKLGSAFATLFGNHSTDVQPGYVPTTAPAGAVPVPHTAVSNQTTTIMVIVAVAVVLLLLLHDVKVEVE